MWTAIKTYVLLCVILPLVIACQGQENNVHSPAKSMAASTKIVGGGCDGCELMFEGMPKELHAVDTSAGWYEKGQKLIITGTVFKLDGTTPAAGVIVYYWHTDNNGYYSPSPGINEKARRHGHLRGWIKTGSDGHYTINTIRPAPYPNDVIPAHIHIAIKEPGIKNEYYIDELNFDEDKLLLPYSKKYPFENRGGSGILRVLAKDSLQLAEHNIILGLNIPDYPGTDDSKKQAGLKIGEQQPSFIPFHAFGPDKGSRACPVCKYGRYHGIIYFVGNRPDWNDIRKWLLFLEAESIQRKQYLKAYFVYGNAKEFTHLARKKELETLGNQLGLKQLALTYVPSLKDKESEVYLNKLNELDKNSFIIFRQHVIVAKYFNIDASAVNFELIAETLNRTQGTHSGWKEISE